MEFANNYYAQVKERDNDKFAMELLVNKRTGEVSLKPGSNMTWNSKYGMMGGISRMRTAAASSVWCVLWRGSGR